MSHKKPRRPTLVAFLPEPRTSEPLERALEDAAHVHRAFGEQPSLAATRDALRRADRAAGELFEALEVLGGLGDLGEALPMVQAACRRRLQDLASVPDKPTNTWRRQLALDVARVLRAHGIEPTVPPRNDDEPTRYVRVLREVLVAVGAKGHRGQTLSDAAACKLAREGSPGCNPFLAGFGPGK
jgi:hypothetical protein